MPKEYGMLLLGAPGRKNVCFRRLGVVDAVEEQFTFDPILVKDSAHRALNLRSWRRREELYRITVYWVTAIE